MAKPKPATYLIGGLLYTLLFAGIEVILSFTTLLELDQGALQTASSLMILIGIAFAFPSLLQDTSGDLSTMRIIVFAVVLLFCTIYLKIGWSIFNFEQFTIDQRWVYILGLAFGSKAFQRFGEKEDEGSVTETSIKQVTIEEKKEIDTGAKGKDTSKDTAK